MELDYPRTDRYDLGFEGIPLTGGRNRLHPHPGSLHPSLIDCLIQTYAPQDQGHVQVFDPFCGSGTTLLRAAMRGLDSFGCDINPLALLISKAKTHTYIKSNLEGEATDLIRSLVNAEPLFLQEDVIDIPPIENMDYWWKPVASRSLGYLRGTLKRKQYVYMPFFLCALAYTARRTSLTQQGEFKRVRIPYPKMKAQQPNVISTFIGHVQAMVKTFVSEDLPRTTGFYLFQQNVEERLPRQVFDYHLVLTSPPYGDSSTTCAYGQYFSFGRAWIAGVSNTIEQEKTIAGVDKEALGKKSPLHPDLEEYILLSETLGRIQSVSTPRAQEVKDFFNGYYRALVHIIDKLYDQGVVCFVVGNRTVRDVEVPMDQITASFLEGLGLTFECILVRPILSKRLPGTMREEFIVVARKP